MKNGVYENPTELTQDLKTHFASTPGYDEQAVQKFAENSYAYITAIPAPAKAPAKHIPDEKQTACYKKCAGEKVIALAAAARLGWPAGAIAAAKAVVDFNACRARCDRG
ncbi:MAG TPA: hypothetical protein VN934_05875 [Candidatus Tumulicola sp.]|nr:hypothetical protein [Candidatus Tumulicola sp.]